MRMEYGRLGGDVWKEWIESAESRALLYNSG